MAKPTPIAIITSPELDVRLDGVDARLARHDSQIDTTTATVSGILSRLEALETPKPAPVPDPVPVPVPTTKPVLLSDMARNFYYWQKGPARDAAYAWLGDRLDLTEFSSDESFERMKAGNPVLKKWLYALDLTVFTSDARAQMMHNDYFILNADGTRKVANIWGSDRWFYDYSKQLTRDVQADWLKLQVANHDGLFLDEHADLGPLKAADITAWLKQLRETLAPKFVIINSAQMATLPDYRDQAIAAGGVCFEWKWSLTQAHGWEIGIMAELSKQITDSGGIVHCLGWWDGDKQRQASDVGDWDREAMGRLAMYWLMKAPGVYLDLQTTPQGPNLGDGDLSWSTWFEALRFDCGEYVGSIGEAVPGTKLGRYVHGQTPNGWWRVVHAAEYSKACVYVRCKDGYDQNDYSDATAVTIPVTGRVLQMDGTLGEPITELRLRNAEAAIVVKG